MSFSKLGLSPELLEAIASQGYESPTPVQQQAIPVVLQGRDVLVAAQTGTGKTAGFTLPLLQRLQESPAGLASETGSCRRGQSPQALILTPTRELAAQVSDSVKTYGQGLRFISTIICGGVSIRPQIKALRRGVDVVIATPGRLLDHLQQGTLDLSRIEILVLDEADRMLDMGFIHDIRKVVSAIPGDRQTLLFSATFSKAIRTLAQDFLTNPHSIQIARQNSAAESVAQRVIHVDQKRKRELLSFMIGSQNWRQVLVFTRTKHRANRLVQQLKLDGLKAAAIHGNKSQSARTRALQQFKEGQVRVLVATDIAARGLDIQDLPYVVNYELPHVPEDYVHRIGRTGRAGQTGEAVSLVCGDEITLLRDIERLLKRRIDSDMVPGYEPSSRPSDSRAGQSGQSSRSARSSSRRGPSSRSSSSRKRQSQPSRSRHPRADHPTRADDPTRADQSHPSEQPQRSKKRHGSKASSAPKLNPARDKRKGYGPQSASSQSASSQSSKPTGTQPTSKRTSSGRRKTVEGPIPERSARSARHRIKRRRSSAKA